MTIVNALLHYVQRVRLARERARTEKLVSELPFEVRKDIGWPGRFQSRLADCDGPGRS